MKDNVLDFTNRRLKTQITILREQVCLQQDEIFALRKQNALLSVDFENEKRARVSLDKELESLLEQQRQEKSPDLPTQD